MVDEVGLRYLGTGYFHQDYDLDADTPSDLVREFAVEDDISYVQVLYSELAEILAAGISEEEARRLWMSDAESSYDPVEDGKSYLDWLGEMLMIIGEVLRQRWLTKRDDLHA